MGPFLIALLPQSFHPELRSTSSSIHCTVKVAVYLNQPMLLAKHFGCVLIFGEDYGERLSCSNSQEEPALERIGIENGAVCIVVLCLQATQWAIDELKSTVPIWKKEYFQDGSIWKENSEAQRLRLTGTS